MPLTDATIRSLVPGDRLVKHSDGEGLQLHVSPTGAKLWRMAYRFDGKQKTLALGRYPDLGLKQARLKKAAARAVLADGRDPMAKEPEGDSTTFADVAAEYVDVQRKRARAPKTMAKLEGHVAQINRVIGKRPMAEVKASEILAFLRSVEAAGKHTTAAAMRSLVSRIFRYGVATDRCTADPAAPLVGALVAPGSDGYPAITDRKAVGGLIRAIRGYEGEPMTRVGLMLVAYTALRPGEARCLRWTDVDFDGAVISIPPERMKKPRPHVVPLSAQVIDFLKEVHPLRGQPGGYVLPSLRSEGRPISDNSLNAALRRLDYPKEQMVAHGFRKMFSTLLNEDGWNADWIEAQLAHVQGGVRGVYNKAEFIEGRTAMMQAYADLLDSLADVPAP